MKVTGVSFSPTGNTKQAVNLLAHAIAKRLEAECEFDSFTLPEERLQVRCFGGEDLVVFGVPTYAGRIPNKALPFVRALFRGSQTKVIPIVSFGNRSYGDALSELCGELSNQGFIPVAAAAFSMEHSFAEIGPKELDASKIEGFADRIIAMIHEKNKKELFVTGNFPPGPYYVPKREDGEAASFLKAKPVSTDACDLCGNCLTVCPMGSIECVDGRIETTGICIKCQACILFCPRKAREILNEDFLSHKRMLERDEKKIKASEFFLSH